MLTTPKQDGTPYDVPYGHTRVFIGAGFDQVLERVVLCLQLQGFHIMASVDLQDALQGAKVNPCISVGEARPSKRCRAGPAVSNRDRARC